MEEKSKHQKRLSLEEEVSVLQDALDKEQKLNQILQCALHGAFVCHSCVSSLAPLQARVLLAELTMVEEEIMMLERKIEDLKMRIYRERNQERSSFRWQQRHFLCGLGGRRELHKLQPLPGLTHEQMPGDESEKLASNHETNLDLCHASSPQCNSRDEESIMPETPNRLSEELLKTLIAIFQKLSQSTNQLNHESHKLPNSCVSSNNFHSYRKTSITTSSKDSMQRGESCGVLVPENEGEGKMGLKHKFVSCTKASLDLTRIELCVPAFGKLRALTHKLSAINPSFLSYKQKLAFWINIYNACIMHAFLQHGFPPSPDKLLALLNKAAINVGGVILNALAIEHFLLRHSLDTDHEVFNEKEGLLIHAYGLGYPEPNVRFALCRGSWSSPALRVYTAEDVVNELETAKTDYLEASVRITSKKKIILPKLLHWHMKDFADDLESLLEWIYSQLPVSGSLKRVLKECLSRDPRIPLPKLVQIQPHRADFRYLLPWREASSSYSISSSF
ncbi:uncharacterized protein LOC122015746 [Zingiber officinale]|uniref:Uncharacterized protein n=1 Tax=Zingiber officinale TaxID=94328 RepID=A0A8J5LRB0_ZINOF|nr:uncharacterized protein LOC122015746 [Zingiber officinale]KAG6535274.1 hypothetical protein ZIOFF_000239 [Zingiber officinale]